MVIRFPVVSASLFSRVSAKKPACPKGKVDGGPSFDEAKVTHPAFLFSFWRRAGLGGPTDCRTGVRATDDTSSPGPHSL